MNIIDNMPIFIVITALLVNIVIGISVKIEFSALMIRCMIVTIVFGVFSYLITDLVKNAVEWGSLSKLSHNKTDAANGLNGELNKNGNNSVLDFKVPPLDDEEFLRMSNESDEGFVEVNPVYMGEYNKDEQG